MIKVAILDDYQNAFEHIIEIENYKDKCNFKIFHEPFVSESEASVALEEFDALFIMRERTPITKSLIDWSIKPNRRRREASMHYLY